MCLLYLKTEILCLSKNCVFFLESRELEGMIKAQHDLSTGLPQAFLQPGYMLTTKHLVFFQENGAAKGNAKMFPFHASKLLALADLPQALAGAEYM